MKLIDAWIVAPTLEAVEEAREEFLAKLKAEERQYLLGFYQPKESQFLRVYTVPSYHALS